MRVIGMPAIYLVIYRRHNKVQQTKGLRANWAMDVGRDAETIWCSDFQTLSFYEKSRAMNKTAYFSFSCDFSFHDTFRQLTMYLKSVILFFILSGRHGKAQVLATSLTMLFMIMKVLIMLLIMLMVIYKLWWSVCKSRFAYFVGKIILAGGKIILEGGKIILAGGKIILAGGIIILAEQVAKLF